jgi:hypothetical protein
MQSPKDEDATCDDCGWKGPVKLLQPSPETWWPSANG